MSVERVKNHLRQWGRDQDIMEFETSSATVEDAAAALGVKPGHIAKTLSFKGLESEALLVVTAGDQKIDNQKFKQTFSVKAKMLSPDQVEAITGHKVGGVCPFGLIEALPVYLDDSLKRFEMVYPACGSSHSAIEVTIDELAEYANATGWVDVCKNKE